MCENEEKKLDHEHEIALLKNQLAAKIAMIDRIEKRLWDTTTEDKLSVCDVCERTYPIVLINDDGSCPFCGGEHNLSKEGKRRLEICPMCSQPLADGFTSLDFFTGSTGDLLEDRDKNLYGYAFLHEYVRHLLLEMKAKNLMMIDVDGDFVIKNVLSPTGQVYVAVGWTGGKSPTEIIRELTEDNKRLLEENEKLKKS